MRQLETRGSRRVVVVESSNKIGEFEGEKFRERIFKDSENLTVVWLSKRKCERPSFQISVSALSLK